MPNIMLRFRKHLFLASLCVCICVYFTPTQCLCEDDNSKVNENLKKALDQAHMKSKPPKKKYQIERPGGGLGIIGDILGKLFFDSMFEPLDEEDFVFPSLMYSQDEKIPFYAYVPVFQTLDGNIYETPEGKSISFTMGIGFTGNNFVISNTDFKYAVQPNEYKPQIDNAIVFVSADNGRIWREIPMKLNERTENHGTFNETWVVDVPLKEITQEELSPIIYFFRAQSNSGSVAMELPITNPGWPPNTAQYFPAVHSSAAVNETEAARNYFAWYDSLQLIDSFIAFDGTNLFLAFRTSGGILPVFTKAHKEGSSGNEFGPENEPLIYALKFAHITGDQPDGFPIGKWQLYAPLWFCGLTPFNLVDLNEMLPKILEFCPVRTLPISANDINIGISSQGLFSQIPLKQICTDECDNMRIVFGAMSNHSIFYLEDYFFLPTFHVYFRTHNIGEEINSALSGTAQGLEPPTQFAPDTGRKWVDEWMLWPENAPNVEAVKSAYEKFISNPDKTF